MARLEIIGGGRMGEALVGGLLGSGWATVEELRVVEASGPRRAELADRLPGVEIAASAGGADGVVLAVKPADVVDVVRTLPLSSGQRVLSIAAGVPLAALEAAVPDGVAVVRAMPNTPSLVGEGASAIAGGVAAGPDDLEWASSLLSAVGLVVQVSEAQLDAVTGLSGSGPAYVFLIAEALVEAGVLEGLPRDVAVALANQTLLGAARLLVESEDPAPVLRAAVTSPGGTTAAGLRALEQAGVRAAVLDAVSAAAARSRQMAGR